MATITAFRMSALRDTYLTYFKIHPSDYLIVVDLDLDGVLPTEGIFDSFTAFQSQPSLDVVCANGQRHGLKYLIWWRWVMFDTYAYEERHDPLLARWLSHDSYWAQVWKRLKRNLDRATPEQ